MFDSYHAGSQSTPSAALLVRLAKRFGQSPGHAAWVALQRGDPVPHEGRNRGGRRPGLAPMRDDLVDQGVPNDGVVYDDGGPLGPHEHAQHELDASAGSGAVLDGVAILGHGSVQVGVGVAPRPPAPNLPDGAGIPASLAGPDGGLDGRGFRRADEVEIGFEPRTVGPNLEVEPAELLADQRHADVQAGQPAEGILHEGAAADAHGDLGVGGQDGTVAVPQVRELDPSHQEARLLAGDPGGDVGGLSLDGGRVPGLRERTDPAAEASHSDGGLLGGGQVLKADWHAGDSESAQALRQASRGGHTELMLARFAREDAQVMSGELPAVWSAYG